MTAPQNSENTTDIYKCQKCNERNTKYIKLEMRSEPSDSTTLKITCMTPNCGNAWIENS
jgi:DNA-directed RNA polymerase subunit M/transcription elongation factor TFIIS